mmetsp:Transcript_31555/g.28731  ORF Transcript_31555/g.28731 Transcript_31555/m.28731 type:complete len:115 (-) Transcript_31555:602-946(-)
MKVAPSSKIIDMVKNYDGNINNLKLTDSLFFLRNLSDKIFSTLKRVTAKFSFGNMDRDEFLPKAIQKMTNIRTISIDDDRIAGFDCELFTDISKAISNLPRIRHFAFSVNSLSI